MVSLITAYMVGLNIKQNLEGVVEPKYIFLMLFTSSGAGFSLVDFVGFFGPLIGMILGFVRSTGNGAKEASVSCCPNRFIVIRFSTKSFWQVSALLR